MGFVQIALAKLEIKSFTASLNQRIARLCDIVGLIEKLNQIDGLVLCVLFAKIKYVWIPVLRGA